MQYSDEQSNEFNGRAILIMPVSKRWLTFFLLAMKSRHEHKRVALSISRNNQCRARAGSHVFENAEANGGQR